MAEDVRLTEVAEDRNFFSVPIFSFGVAVEETDDDVIWSSLILSRIKVVVSDVRPEVEE